MLDEIKLQLPDYEIKPITKQNFEQAFEIYDSNQDFFLLTQNKKATISESVNDIEALPPDCSITQKIYAGLYKGEKIIAVIDLIERYPNQTSFWIGLLLVRGDMQGKKIGSKIINAILNSAEIAGYQTAQLGVIETNKKAIVFWQRHGFEISGHNDNIAILKLQKGNVKA
jgi:GNAT superfamily N-acetyltransferase